MRIGLLLLFTLYSLHSYTKDFETLEKNSACSPFASYQEFQTFLLSRNPKWTTKTVQNYFPSNDFERVTEKLECFNTSYQVDGVEIFGVVVKPKTQSQEKLPILVYNRGGNRSYGSLVFARIMRDLAPLAERGFIVVASQYRGFFGTEPERYGKDEFGGADVKDVHRIIDLIKQHPNADPNNIFMYGLSRGGMMSYLVAKDRKDITAMAIHAGPTDLLSALAWRPEMEKVYQSLIPNYLSHKEQQLKHRSVIYWPEKLPKNLPILLQHGALDERVNVADSKNLAAKLKQLSHPVELRIYQQEGHSFKTSRQDAINEVLNWFKHHYVANK